MRHHDIDARGRCGTQCRCHCRHCHCSCRRSCCSSWCKQQNDLRPLPQNDPVQDIGQNNPIYETQTVERPNPLYKTELPKP